MGQERKSYVSKNVLGCGAVGISSDKAESAFPLHFAPTQAHWVDTRELTSRRYFSLLCR